MTIWLDGIPGGYHAAGCPCDRHCLNCWDDLDVLRELHERLIAEGRPGAPARPLHPLARYCSDYCRNRAKRDRALDRWLAARSLT
jgi:hypothetical protein